MAHAGGRPTALTPEVLEDVRRLLPTCLYIETVADFICLDRTTVRKWLKHGAKEHQRVSRNKRARIRQAEALYVELFSTLFRGVTAIPSARSRAICLRPTDPSLVELTTPLAATTRNQGSRLDSLAVSVARTKATWRAVTCKCLAMVP
jgi:hypothetical protein